MPRCHLEDITRADFYGFVVPFVNELMATEPRSGHPGARSAPATPWATACPITEVGAAAQRAGHRLRPAALFRRAQRDARMARPQRFLQGRRQRLHGVALRRLRASTARCSASASARATCRWRPWCWNTRRCAARSTAWTPPSSPRSRITYKNEIGYKIPPMTPVCRPQLQRYPCRHPRRRPA